MSNKKYAMVYIQENCKLLWPTKNIQKFVNLDLIFGHKKCFYHTGDASEISN
jgi:hypothetical protein